MEGPPLCLARRSVSLFITFQSTNQLNARHRTGYPWPSSPLWRDDPRVDQLFARGRVPQARLARPCHRRHLRVVPTPLVRWLFLLGPWDAARAAEPRLIRPIYGRDVAILLLSDACRGACASELFRRRLRAI